MLLTFLGSPCSGKTTVAALVFAALKDSGVPAEFLPEQARLYIAERRAVTGRDFRLGDVDQLMIMKKQLDAEGMMLRACGPNVVVVTDSSPLNSLLYMQVEARAEPSVREMVLQHQKHAPTAFRVNTVSPGFGDDPNRIHDMKTSFKLDSVLPEVLNSEAPWLYFTHLVGSSRQRTDTVLATVFSQLLKAAS